MGRTIQEKVEQALRAAFFNDPPPEGRCVKITLVEMPRGADPVRLFTWPVPREPRPDSVNELATQIAEYAQEHTDAYNMQSGNQRKLFSVHCLFGPAEQPLLSSSPFAVRASAETTLATHNPDGTIAHVLDGSGVPPDSALPPMPAYGMNQQGAISLPGMVTDLHRLLIASTAQTIQSQQNRINRLEAQLETAQTGRINLIEMIEELADRRLERENIIADRQRKAEREDKMFEVFKPLAFLLGNRIAGKPVLPAEHPIVMALREAFAQMTPTQAHKIMNTFEPAQAATFLEIYRMFAEEEDEKRQIEKEKAEKKAAESAGTTPVNTQGQETSNGTPPPPRLPN